MKYEIIEDSGASEIIEADSLEEALEKAQEWASEGDYDERVMVDVWAHELDEDGERTGEFLSGEVAAGPEPKPEPTECGDDDEDHDWQSPVELVGGCKGNPGVFSTGTRFDYHYVCGKCGTYKHSWDQGQQRNPGDLDEGVEYTAADERSLAWVAEQE
jgi:hypothetical protein